MISTTKGIKVTLFSKTESKLQEYQKKSHPNVQVYTVQNTSYLNMFLSWVNENCKLCFSVKKCLKFTFYKKKLGHYVVYLKINFEK